MSGRTIDSGSAAWEPAQPATTKLGPDEVHVWRISVRQPPPVLERWRVLLTAEERARLERFRFPDDATRELVSRGALRAALGAYLGVGPATVTFATEEKGKPVLATVPAAGRIEFNTSHAGEWVLLAFAHGRPVGVDVERWREVDSADLVRGYFSPGEIAEWESLPEATRIEGFFNGWTRKEAYLKALGVGLAKPLDSFQVRLAPGAPAGLVADRDDPEAGTRWKVWPVPVGPGYAGAVVAPRGIDGARWFAWA